MEYNRYTIYIWNQPCPLSFRCGWVFTLPKTAGFPQLHERVPGYTPPDAEKVRFREVEGLGWMLKLDENKMIP